jgi:hypothetical protein
MKSLSAAPDRAWGGFLGMIREELPDFNFDATGRFGIDTLQSVAANLRRIHQGLAPFNHLSIRH